MNYLKRYWRSTQLYRDIQTIKQAWALRKSKGNSTCEMAEGTIAKAIASWNHLRWDKISERQKEYLKCEARSILQKYKSLVS